MFFIIISNVYEDIAGDFSQQKSLLSQKLRGKGFSDEEIQAIFSDKRIALYPEILTKKGKGLNYFHRKFGLLSRKYIEQGQKIMKEHSVALKQIEDSYGVEKEFLIAIFRVETNFGRYLGNYPVFNSLLTLTLFENPRSAWAEEELVNLLILCKKNKHDPFSMKGSWAGAFGLCQFVPSSFIEYAVDGNGDGAIDLFNFHDAIASIAHYLKSHGWEKGNVEKNKKAIWSYNHCDNYVKAVLSYSKAIKGKKRA